MQKEVDKINRSRGDGDCPKCNGKGFIAFYSDENEQIEVYECSCEKERLTRERIKNSGLEQQFQEQTLETFKADNKFQETLKKIAIDYIINGGKSWFSINGQVGCGKTHLITAIAKALIDKGSELLYLSYNELLLIERDMMNFDINVSSVARARLNQIKNAEIVVIDDFLKQRYVDTVFDIVNYRYVNDLKVITSSEKSYEEQARLDKAVASRIYEKSGKYYVEISADEEKNYRLKGGK